MASATLTDGSSLPIHTIFCIGRNYAGHARELNNPIPEEPVVFIKPDTTIIHHGDTIRLPRASTDVHHEAEMVVVLGNGGKYISPDNARDLIAGYGVGIDVTARDIQNKAKKNAYPWAVGKGFDTFAPISEFIPARDMADPDQLEICLEVNGRTVQQGHVGQMLFPVVHLISWLSEIFTLQPGDLIFTGTPAGVGRFIAGDRLRASLTLAGAPLTRLEVTATDEPRTARQG